MGKFFNNDHHKKEQHLEVRPTSRGKTNITKKIFGSFTQCVKQTSVDTSLERQKYRERTPSTKKTIPTQGKFFSKSSGKENKPVLRLKITQDSL